MRLRLEIPLEPTFEHNGPPEKGTVLGGLWQTTALLVSLPSKAFQGKSFLDAYWQPTFTKQNSQFMSTIFGASVTHRALGWEHHEHVCDPPSLLHPVLPFPLFRLHWRSFYHHFQPLEGLWMWWRHCPERACYFMIESAICLSIIASTYYIWALKWARISLWSA